MIGEMHQLWAIQGISIFKKRFFIIVARLNLALLCMFSCSIKLTWVSSVITVLFAFNFDEKPYIQILLCDLIHTVYWGGSDFS